MSQSHRLIQCCFMAAGLFVGFTACAAWGGGSCPQPQSIEMGTYSSLKLTTQGEPPVSIESVTLEQLEIRNDSAVLSYRSSDGIGKVTFTIRTKYPIN
jgi:hypothetical protein